tara:strand:- start:1719 stop:1883 length:165 start_codon:yes stop_codon:yes gene_type:complete
MKGIMRDLCFTAIGANITLFALGTMWGNTDMMWLALGSGLLCAIGLRFKQERED